MGKKRSQIFAARRRKSRDERKQAERKIEMILKNEKMESEKNKKDSCSSEADNASEFVTYCESPAGKGPDVSQLDTLSTLDVSTKCKTDMWGSEDICQAHNVLGSEGIWRPHDEFRRSATLGVESDVHQGSEHDPHSNVSIKCETDVRGSEDVLECQYEVCNIGATVGVESHDHQGSDCEETGEFGEDVSYRIFLNDDWGTDTTGENTYVSDCDMLFSDEIRLSDVENHFELHDEGQCVKMSTNKPRLNGHEKVHISEKPFVCEDCGLEFVNKNDLVNHRNSHIGENPSICSNFYKMFSDEEKWNKHHAGINTCALADDLSGVNSFACSQCDEKFARESDLHAHLGFHGSEGRTVSELCTEEVSSNCPPSEQVRHRTEQRDSTDSASSFDYHKMERLISEIDKRVYSRESSSSVACREDSPENSEIDTREKLDVRAECKMKFPDIVSMQELVCVISEKIYPCPVCGIVFTRKRPMLAHQASAHSGYKTIACEVCKKTFAQNDRLNKHMKTHTRRKPYACCYCDMKFWWKYSLKSHERIHYVEKSYACRRCDMRFSGKTALNLHKRIHYNENPYTCDVCMKQFVYKAQLIRHNKQKCFFDQHRQTYINSDEIPSVTVFVPHVQTPPAEMAASKNNDFPVEQNKSLFDLTGIKVGKNLEFEIEDIMSADECEKDGPTEEITVEPGKNSSADIDVNSDPNDLATEFNKMKRSCLMTSANPGYKPFACDVCKKTFIHKDRLKHMRTHTRTPYACCYCGMKFSRKYSLKSHERIHYWEKTYTCCFCDMRFSGKTALNVHKRIHYNENPYTCDVCMKQFVYKAQLIRHNTRKCFLSQRHQTRKDEIPSATVCVPVQRKK